MLAQPMVTFAVEMQRHAVLPAGCFLPLMSAGPLWHHIHVRSKPHRLHHTEAGFTAHHAIVGFGGFFQGIDFVHLAHVGRDAECQGVTQDSNVPASRALKSLRRTGLLPKPKHTPVCTRRHTHLDTRRVRNVGVRRVAPKRHRTNGGLFELKVLGEQWQEISTLPALGAMLNRGRGSLL